MKEYKKIIDNMIRIRTWQAPADLCKVYNEEADALRTLLAENDRLKKENEELKKFNEAISKAVKGE